MFTIDGLDTIDDDTVRIGRFGSGEDIFDMCRMIQFHFFYAYFFVWIYSLPSTDDLVGLFFPREVLDVHIIVCQEILEDL